MRVPWVGYLPVPGLQVVPVLVAPDDRLSRFHAWQSGVLVLLWLSGLMLAGFLRSALPSGARDVVDLLAGLWALAGAVLLVIGLVGAARGRFTRLPVVAPVLTGLRR